MNKIKIMIPLIFFILISCDEVNYNSYKIVMQHYPNAKIYKKDDKKFSFLVLDSGILLDVKCSNTNNDSISEVTTLKELKMK